LNKDEKENNDILKWALIKKGIKNVKKEHYLITNSKG